MSAAPQSPVRIGLDPDVAAALDASFAASLAEVVAEFVEQLRESLPPAGSSIVGGCAS